MKKAGFTHIRLPIDPSQLSGSSDKFTIPAQRLHQIKQIVQMALGNGLAVAIDFHRQDFEFKRQLAQNEDSLNQFLIFVQSVTRETVPLSRQKIFYEVLNEPDFGAFDQNPVQGWYKVQNKIIQAIRRVAPNNTLVVKGHNDSIKSLMESKLIPDSNVVYSIHYYENHVFTHQGANWDRDMPELAAYQNLPYPAQRSTCKTALQRIPASISSHSARKYCDSHFDAQHIYQDFKRIEDWANGHHIHLYLSEFGVYKPNAPQADRKRWIHDVRFAAKQNNISWAMWEYNKSFGIVSYKSGLKVDCATLEALGLPNLQHSTDCL